MSTAIAAPALESSTDSRGESLLLWIIVLWIGSMLYFDPRILALITGSPSVPVSIAIAIVVVCLNLFWFYTIYYSVAVIASSWLRKRSVRASIAHGERLSYPAVAFLYPTRNDFRPSSVEQLLRQDYPNFRVFILDDSTLLEYSERIDRWAAGHQTKVSVIRRPVRSGFKAGNLNYGLRQVAADYPFFAVCDDDGIFPRSFVRDLLPIVERDASVAFVQAKQVHNSDQQDPFGSAMGFLVGTHYRHYVRARADYGFVMFYGHGALMRTSTWREAGGFPEIVTEDLAYSAKIRTLGYRGVFTEDVVCYEDYPATYAQLRRRTEKWIRGTAEFLKIGYGEFFKSPRVPWFEKVDVLVHATTHFMAVPMLLFLLLLGTLLPASMFQFRYPGSFFVLPVPAGKNPFDYVGHIRYHVAWPWDLYLMMMLTVFCPLIPLLLDQNKSPFTLARSAVSATFVYFSCLYAEACSFFAFLITGKAFFRNTDDAAGDRHLSIREFVAEYHPNHPVIWLGEVLVGLTFVWAGLHTRNLWFFAPASALMLSPFLHYYGWRNRLLRLLTTIPFSIGVLICAAVTAHLIVSSLS